MSIGVRIVCGIIAGFIGGMVARYLNQREFVKLSNEIELNNEVIERQRMLADEFRRRMTVYYHRRMTEYYNELKKAGYTEEQLDKLAQRDGEE